MIYIYIFINANIRYHCLVTLCLLIYDIYTFINANKKYRCLVTNIYIYIYIYGFRQKGKFANTYQIWPWYCRRIIVEEMWTNYDYFFHDRPWISAWIKSISNELDITFHVLASQLCGHCDVISNRLWRQQHVNRVTHGVDVWRSSFLSPFMDSFYRVRNEIMNVLAWRTVSALHRVLFSVYFLHCCATNKHQNNPLVSAETVRHTSAYIILYIFDAGLTSVVHIIVCLCSLIVKCGLFGMRHQK